MKKKLIILFITTIFLLLNSCGETGGSSSDTALITPVEPEILNSFSGKIDENASFGTTIGRVDLSNLVIFEMKDIILSGDGSENFLIDKSGLLILNRDAKIDYETRNTYNLALTITDIEGNSKATVVTIEVVNIPEEVASLENFTATIEENSPSDTLVGKVAIISQGDSPITSMTLSGDNSSSFTVDKEGTIKVSSSAILDYEKLKSYNLLVTATNISGDSKPATVTINLSDKGELVPVIRGFNGSVLENSQEGSSIIGTVTIVYSGDTPITNMTLSGDGSENFTIDSKYGLVTLGKNPNIDYESKNIYNLTAIATNSAGDSIPQNITISVVDSADVTPIINNVSVKVIENTPKDNIIDKINISTIGDSPISTISLSGDGAEDFRVDTQGNIYIVNPPDYEKKYQYVLTAVATNKAGDSTSQGITIAITDIPDVAPTINSFSANIRENIALNSVVGTINITSEGDSPISTINLSGIGAEHFSVDNKGRISVFSITPPLDTQVQRVYSLKAIATNAGGTSTPTDITITLEDIANKVPLIESVNANIVENSQANTIVGIINIRDVGDSPINSITLTGDGKEDFIVDTKGIITVVNPPDYEKDEFIKTYTLKAVATNTAGASNIVDISITVLPVADVIPIIDNFSPTIDENIPVGTIISGNIPIIVKGDSEISKISLTGVGAEYFTVATNGQITIAKSPDYETQNKFNLIAVATNDAGISLSKSVTITITDIPDIMPIIDNFSTTIKESLTIGSVVGNINIITNGDRPITAINLSGGNAQYFSVAIDGTITVALALNYETITSYSLVAVATNDAGDSISKSVVINIEDVPDVVATLSTFTTTVIENTAKGTNIGNIVINSQGDRNITSINLSGTDAEHFKVETNGSIYIVIPPDFETNQNYTLQATAITISGSSIPSNVTINITNVEEDRPTADSFFERIKDSDINGTVVGTVVVDEKDSAISDVNLSGIGSENFNITLGGEITIAHSENIFADDEYNLEVTFTNNSGEGLPSSVIIAVDGADTTRPTVIISSNHDLALDTVAYLSGTRWKIEEITYNFDFSEDVVDFNLSDINISGDNINSRNFNGSGSFYTLTLQAPFNSNQPIIVKIDENVTKDSSGNFNIASSTIIQSVDTYQPFITTWRTDNLGNSTDYQIKINIDDTRTDYNFSIDWGDNSSNINLTSDIVHTYGTIGDYTIKIKGDFPKFLGNNMDANDVKKLISIEQWGTIEWQDMSNSFNGCINMNSIIKDRPNLSNVTDMSYMFANTNFNQNIDSWNVSTITNMEGMFEEADSFDTDISSWDVQNVTNMNRMFYGTNNFSQDLSIWAVNTSVTHTDFNTSNGGGLTPPNW